jgi:hypothetical protein
MGVVRTRLVGNLVGSLAVLGVAALISFGLPAVDRTLPAERRVAPGQPYEVGGGVRVFPPPGALLDVTKTRPGPDRGTALFLVGQVRYLIVVVPFPGSLRDAADRLRQKITATRGYQVTGRQGGVSAGDGLVGIGGGYAAPGRLGRYSVFVVDGVAIEITVSGADVDLRRTLPAIDASIRSLSYRDRP